MYIIIILYVLVFFFFFINKYSPTIEIIWGVKTILVLYKRHIDGDSIAIILYHYYFIKYKRLYNDSVGGGGGVSKINIIKRKQFPGYQWHNIIIIIVIILSNNKRLRPRFPWNTSDCCWFFFPEMSTRTLCTTTTIVVVGAYTQ